MTLTVQRRVLSPRTLQVVTQLARFEGHRQLRSPFLWLAIAASMVLVWLAVHDEPATLWARSVTIAGSCLPIAVTVLLLGNGAALRDHSSRVGETTETPPTGKDLRMLGLVAGAWAAVLLSTAVVVFGVVLSVTDEPAGSFIVPEIVVGPLVVLLGQALGVMLGRWIPNPWAAPLTLVVLVGLFLIQDFWPGERTIPAASPFLPWRKGYTLDWVQGEPRMPLLHLVYLTGLIGLMAALASRSWRAVGLAGILVAGTAVGLASIDTAGEEVSAAVDRWAASQPQICQEDDGVRFCAIDGYQPWIDDWAAVVDRIDQLVPGEIGLEEVEQTTRGLAARNDTDPTVAHVHGRLPVDGDLAQQILAPELGLPSTGGEAAAMNADRPACMAEVLPVFVSGEARAVAYLVLTEMAVPNSVETGGFAGSYQFGHIETSTDEVALAFQILSRPESEILAMLYARWNEVTDRTTASATLAGWFELEAPEVIGTSSYEGMNCVCIEGGIRCSG